MTIISRFRRLFFPLVGDLLIVALVNPVPYTLYLLRSEVLNGCQWYWRCPGLCTRARYGTKDADQFRAPLSQAPGVPPVYCGVGRRRVIPKQPERNLHMKIQHVTNAKWAQDIGQPTMPPKAAGG